MKKQFKGIVQKYDSDSNHHTVKWDNAPKGSDGVTEVDLTEGELTWLAPPAKVKKSRRASAEGKASMAKGKPGETMKELEHRFTGKTTKAVAFQVLKDSGPEGMTLAEIVHESQKAGLRDWSTCKQPKTTINVCVSQDAAFVKISPGRVGLRVNGAKPRDPAEALSLFERAGDAGDADATSDDGGDRGRRVDGLEAEGGAHEDARGVGAGEGGGEPNEDGGWWEREEWWRRGDAVRARV